MSITKSILITRASAALQAELEQVQHNENTPRDDRTGSDKSDNESGETPIEEVQVQLP